MNMENPMVEPTKEEEKIKFEDGDVVRYKDGRKCKVVGEEGNLYLGKGLINVNFEGGDNEVEGVRVSDLEKVEEESDDNESEGESKIEEE